MLCQINQKILKATKNGHSASSFLYDFQFQLISERTSCRKDFTYILEILLNENNCNFNSNKLS